MEKVILTLKLLTAILPPIFCGYLLTSILCPRWTTVLKTTTGVCIGLGLSSGVYFIIAMSPLKTNTGRITDFLLWLILLCVLSAFKKSDTTKEPAHADTQALFLKTSFYILLVLGVVLFAIATATHPHGEWDAWATWNSRAKFLYHGRDYFFNLYNNCSDPITRRLDYPLLLPSLIARNWLYAGSDTIAAPIATALLFSLAIPFILFELVRSMKNRETAFIAASVLAGTAFFWMHGSSQYSDVPLSAFILITIGTLAYHEKLPADPKPLILAGLAASLAFWTKNEGRVLAAGATFAVALFAFKRGALKQSAKELLYFLAGFLVCGLICVYYKTAIAPASEFEFSSRTLLQAFNPKRLVELLTELPPRVLKFNEGSLMLIALLYISGRTKFAEHKSAFQKCVFIMTVMIAGYCMAYLSSPYGVSWLMNDSVERLVLQIYPSLLLTLFMRSDFKETNTWISKLTARK